MGNADISAFAQFHDRLIANGYSPIPIIPGTKRPAICQWSKASLEPLCRAIREKFSQSRWHCGLGVALGFKDVVALDLDVEDGEIVAALRSVLPTTPVKKRGGKGGTGFFRMPNAESRRFRDASGRTIIELLGPGCQTVLPPTPHPSGCRYFWIGTKSLIDVHVDELPQLPADIRDRIECVLRPWLPESPAHGVATALIRQPDRYLDAVIRRRVEELARTAVGGRNRELNCAAYRLARLGLSKPELFAILSPVAAGIGLAHQEIARTIHSAWVAGSGQGESHGL